MNGNQSAKIYMVAMLALLTALLVGAVFFLAGMQSSSYLVSNGAEYSLRFIDQLVSATIARVPPIIIRG